MVQGSETTSGLRRSVVTERLSSLSVREKEVAIAYAEGKTSKEIAQAFFISPATVRNHVAAIYRKLELRNKVDLIRFIESADENPRLIANEEGIKDEAEEEQDKEDNLVEIAEPLIPRDASRPPDNSLLEFVFRFRTRRSAQYLIMAAVTALVVSGGGTAWFVPWTNFVSPEPIARTNLTLPAKPSIAVLPFVNMSGDPEQNYFVDGMTEDLITDLSKISSLFVISRNSTFTFKGRSVRVRDVAEQLGVRYVMEGSVRRAGEKVRVNAQLIDGSTGAHVWADRYDEPSSDVFAVQDRVTRRIVEALTLNLLPDEAQRIARFDTDNVAAHDAYLLGLSSYYRRSPADNALAKDFFEQAIRLDPGYGAAYTALAKVYVQAVIGEQAYADELGIFWLDGYARAWTLLEQDEVKRDADYHILRSWLSLRKHQHQAAIAEAELALQLEPNDADAMEALAEALVFAGQPDSGLEYAVKAMRQNPALPGRPLYLMGLAEFALGRTERALDYLERAISEAPSNKADFSAVLATAYAEAGRVDEAKSSFETYRQGLVGRPARAASGYTGPFANARYHTWRRVDLASSVYSFPFSDQGVLDRFARALHAAGASASVGGYLSLHSDNRLSGSKTRSLLFGKEIEGKDFWLSRFSWRQVRAVNGTVQHFGHPVHPGLPSKATGQGEIKDDLLCERWPAVITASDICITIYHIPERKARVRWGDYIMITDAGPQPFKIIE